MEDSPSITYEQVLLHKLKLAENFILTGYALHMLDVSMTAAVFEAALLKAGNQ